MKPDLVDKFTETVRPMMKNKITNVNAKPTIIPSIKTEKSTTSSQTETSNVHCYACEFENDIRQSDLGNCLRWVSKLHFETIASKILTQFSNYSAAYIEIYFEILAQKTIG